MGKVGDLAIMNTTTVGTGTITLGTAVTGFISFAAAGIADGDLVSYAIRDGSASETGTGTYTTSGTTLTRTVKRSTNSDSAISLSGTAEVFLTPNTDDLIGEQTVNFLSLVPRTTSGAAAYTAETATNDTMISGFEFATAVDEGAQIAFPLPKSYDGGPLTFGFYATTADTAGTGNFIWRVRAKFIRNDDAINAAWGSFVSVTDSFIAAQDQHRSPLTGDVTPGGTFATECMLYVEIERNGTNVSDTYTQGIVLQATQMKYNTESGTDT